MSSEALRGRLPAGPRSRVPGRVIWQYRSRPIEFLEENAARFGPVFAFSMTARRFYVLAEPELIRRVLVAEADKFHKGPALKLASDTLGNGLLSSEDPLHRRQRALMQPWFHAQWVRRYAAAMVAVSKGVTDGWQPGSVVDVHQQMTRLTVVAAGQTLFGLELDQSLDVIGPAMDALLKAFNRLFNPVGRLMMRLPLPSTLYYARQRDRILTLVENLIAEKRRRLAAGQIGDDLLTTLLTANKESQQTQMTDRQLRDECYTLLAAGHETTSSLLTFALYLLGRHQPMAEELRRQVMQVLGDAPAAPEAIGEMPLLQHVISETLRLYPPAWMMARTAIAPFDCGDFVVPVGSIVFLPQWLLHRDSRWWPHAGQFDPGRWAASDDQRPRFAYFPFGGGRRQCIGDSFALQEAALALATIMQRGLLAPVSDEPLRVYPSITLRPADKVLLRLLPAQASGQTGTPTASSGAVNNAAH